ncbi:MAG: FAD-binding oxidoreductase [Actinobacteria bacterium]|nr:FAD-binding oxidoreductase [Actinomycetota bacterium]MCG2795331.1 FAD-binding oxidoreductase [Actinomycetes bacterium]MBU4241019.1 FAD-binding oxidoreductase [Actinomycetota bacterium]MBU4302412.1 FAD-binding oxidoreductase [Actinomycetota bacterium]MBU4385448.1 FAD-binding oxidoreductase [Actinomycetota bacterium]
MAVRKLDTTAGDLYREVKKGLEKIVGEEWVSDNPTILIGYSRDQSLETARSPNIVVLPDSTEQVSEILSLANQRGVAVTPWSTGGNTGGGCIPQRGGILLDMSRMDRILELDEENMSVRIQPGVTFGKVYVEAEKRGLRNVCPSAPASVSMLANYLDKGVFQVSNKYGVGTDSILGMVIVQPDGTVLRTGCLFQDSYGSVCVEGPGPDISGIFQGSMGIFGVCTEMVAQLYPLPEFEEILAAQFEEDDLEGVAEFLREVARADCSFESLLFQDAYMAMGMAPNQESAEVIRAQLPRQNAILFYGGETAEEMEIRREQLDGILERTGTELAPEGMLELLKELVPWKRVFKIIQVTPRVERLTGCFELFWFNIAMDEVADMARGFMKLARKNFASTDPEAADRPFPYEETTFYIQPLEFGRTCMLEMDAYPNQGEPEGVKRGLAMAAEAIPFICGAGGLFDRPYGGVDSGFGWVQTPMLGNYYELLRGLKRLIDPSNTMNPGRLALPADPAGV